MPSPLVSRRSWRAALALLLLATLASLSAAATRPVPERRPGFGAPEIRQRVERFSGAHPELGIGRPDLDRIVALLERAHRVPPGAETPTAFERASLAHRISDDEIRAALAALGLRPQPRGVEPARPTGAVAAHAARGGGPTETAAIAGRVTDAGTELGLEGVTVQIFDSSASLVSEAVTDGSGDYETSHTLPSGTFYARANSSSTHLGELYDDIVCWQDCNESSGTAIVLDVGEVATGIDFALVAGGSIAGVVTDAQSSAELPDIQIDLYDTSGDYIGSTSTDANGEYAFSPLAAGDYRVRTYDTDGYVSELYDDIECAFDCDLSVGDAVTVVQGASTTGIDFALTPGASIRGTVLDAETDLPIEGVAVFVYGTDGNTVTTAFTAADGTYETGSSLPNGTYYLRTEGPNPYLDELYGGPHCWQQCDVTAGTPVAVTVSGPLEGIDFALDAGGKISGTVTGGGNPLVGILVGVYDADGDFVDEISSDGDGNYSTVRGLVTGSYRVRTYGQGEYLDELFDNLPCFYTFGCNITAGTAVAVVEGQETPNIDFDLPLGGKIAGTVTDADSLAGLDNVEVAVYASNGEIVSYNYTSGGTYQTTYGMPTGTYYVVTQNSGGYVDESYDDVPCVFDCDPLLGTGVTVTAGATTNDIDFALDVGGSISGTVTDAATDDPISSVVLSVWDSTGKFAGNAYSDSEGNWKSEEGLTSGDYHVRTFNNLQYLDELYANLPCPFDCDETTGADIAVTLGAETVGVDFALAKGGAIAGTVIDAQTALPGDREFDIKIFDATGVRVDRFEASPTGATWETRRGLPSGIYYVTASDDSSGAIHRGALYPAIPCPWGECPATVGAPVTVTVPETTEGIDIPLQRRALSADGFESQGFGAWDAGTGTGATACAHPICVQGGELDPACDPCVATILESGPSMCGEFFWSSDCIVATYTLCGVSTCEWLPDDD